MQSFILIERILEEGDLVGKIRLLKHPLRVIAHEFALL